MQGNGGGIVVELRPFVALLDAESHFESWIMKK